MSIFKKLSGAVLLLFFSIISFAQGPAPVQRATKYQPVKDAYVFHTLGVSIPKVIDTAHGLNGGQDSLGLLIQVVSTGLVYHRDTTAGGHKWTLIGSGGGSSYTDPLTTRGDLLYHNATITTRLPGNSTSARQFLIEQGTGASPLDPFLGPLTSPDIVTGLGFTPQDLANLSTNTALGGSNTFYPSQLAVKTYVDAAIAGSGPGIQHLTVRNGLFAVNDSVVEHGTNPLLHNTVLSASNAWRYTLDSMQSASGRGFRVNFTSDATGDIFYRDANGNWTRLGIGSTNQVVTVIAGLPSWQTPSAGFADPLTTNGDVIARVSGSTTRLAQGSNGTFLGVSGGVLGYFTPSSGFSDPLTTNGDLIGRVGGITTRFPIGSANTVLHGGAALSYSTVVEADETLSNNTTNNVSTSKHGYAPILPNDATKYLDGTGAYSVPPGAGSVTGSGATNRVAYWSSSSALTSTANFTQIAGDLNSDSLSTHRLRTDSVVYKSLVTFQPPDSIYISGNSIAVGTGASPIDSSYANRFGASKGLTVYNDGLSSTGILNAIGRAYLHSLPGNQMMTVSEAGLNDARYGTFPGNALKVQNKIVIGTKAIFAAQNLYSSVQGGTGTTGGTWNSTAWPAYSEGGKSTLAAYTNSSGATMTYTVTTSAANPNIVIGWIHPSTSTVQATVTDGGSTIEVHSFTSMTDGLANNSPYSGTYMPGVSIYTGLATGSHTIVITYTSGSGLMMIDYIGTLLPAASCRPMVIMELPHMDATGYATAPANATQAILDTISARLDTLQAGLLALGYPVFIGKTNVFYTATNPTDLSSDHIHPNNVGHREIFNAVTSAMTNNLVLTTPTNGTNFFANVPYTTVNGQVTEVITALSGNVRYIQNQVGLVQNAGFNIGLKSFINNKLQLDSILMGGQYSVSNTSDTANDIYLGRTASNDIMMSFRNNKGITNERKTRFTFSKNNWSVGAVSDDESTNNAWISFNRSGNAITNVEIPVKLLYDGTVTQESHTLSTASQIGIEYTGAAVTGSLQYMKATLQATAGIQRYIQNVSGNTSGYVNDYLIAEAGDAYTQYRHNAGGKEFGIGINHSSDNFEWRDGTLASGNLLASISQTGVYLHKMWGGLTASGSFAAGAGAGTGNSISLPFFDAVSGQFSITAGSSPSAGAVLVTVTIPTQNSSTFRVMLSCVSCSGIPVEAVATSATTFTISDSGAGTVLTNGTTYKWNWLIIQ